MVTAYFLASMSARDAWRDWKHKKAFFEANSRHEPTLHMNALFGKSWIVVNNILMVDLYKRCDSCQSFRALILSSYGINIVKLWH